jgi:hypothetical protein
VDSVKHSSTILLILLVLFSANFTDYADSIKSMGKAISRATSRINDTIQESSVSIVVGAMRAIGVVKITEIHPEDLDLPDPVEISEDIPCVVVASGSLVAKILNASPINASAMTVNPIGIVTIGDMAEGRQKEEMYHWWNASQMGPVAYYTSYVVEFSLLCISKLSSNDAYATLEYEKVAKDYAYDLYIPDMNQIGNPTK